MKNNRTLVIVIVLLLLVFCCCATAVGAFLLTRGLQATPTWFGSIGNVEATAEFERALSTTGPVELSIEVPVGDIEVLVGADDQLTIRATKHAWGRTAADAEAVLARMVMDVEQQGNQVALRVTGEPWTSEGTTGLRSPSVDIVVVAPSQTSLQVDSRVGKVTAEDLRGDLRVGADVGEVILRNIEPSTRLEVTSRVASIRLEGPLSPNAGYFVTSDIGAITLRLPDDSTFALDARSDIGNVNVGFALSGRSERGIVGKEVRGNVGADPTTQLYLRSRVGEISVQPGR